MPQSFSERHLTAPQGTAPAWDMKLWMPKVATRTHVSLPEYLKQHLHGHTASEHVSSFLQGVVVVSECARSRVARVSTGRREDESTRFGRF